MSTNVTPTIREGSPTAREVYLSVGVALSWWEASEDMLEMLFVHLCKKREPIAIETFRVAPRPARVAMIKSALTHYASRVTPAENSAVLDALKKLEKLSSTRNEIAHGYVSEFSVTVDDSVTMRGNFLSSTLSPIGDLTSREANTKYAHTAAEIDEWRDKVRHERGRIMDVWEAIITRDQESQQQVEG
jgi:hypothetical protein